MQILQFLNTLTEETLTIQPTTQTNLPLELTWEAKLETIGPPTIAYGECAMSAIQALIQKIYPNSTPFRYI
jgi:hypothetical protein